MIHGWNLTLNEMDNNLVHSRFCYSVLFSFFLKINYGKLRS